MFKRGFARSGTSLFEKRNEEQRRDRCQDPVQSILLQACLPTGVRKDNYATALTSVELSYYDVLVVCIPAPGDTVQVPDSGHRFTVSPHSHLPSSVYQLDS